MRRVELRPGADLDGFRRAVRALVAGGVPPAEIVWTSGEPGLFRAGEIGEAPLVQLPRKLGELIQEVVPHRDPERYALLYDLVWRSLRDNLYLVEVASDPVVHRLELMRKAVRRDIHKMHAFLRFGRSRARSDTSPGSSRSISFWNLRLRSSSTVSGRWSGRS